jgi:hypothetical protein
MMRLLKVFVIVIAAGTILYFAFVRSLAYYDSQTRKELMQTVARELRVGASKEEMTEFLHRHTSRFALDEQYKHEYGGFIPQTKWDHFWFERRVQILFKLNSDGTLKDTEIWVFYTGL